MRIDEIDRNMAVFNRVTDADIAWRDVHEAPFTLHGFCSTAKGDLFRRVPADVAEKTNPGVMLRATNTAGGRVRFATDSDVVAIHAEIGAYSPIDLVAYTSMAGFALYVEAAGKDVYVGTFRPGIGMETAFESKLPLPGVGMRQVTICFPLYGQVDNLCVGLREGARIEAHRPYRHQVPVVYYGSSITQGGCASRSGNEYPALISRMLDCEYRNLGFAGSAKGEDAIAEYMAGLDMSVFVCDYDHNAPTPDHLRATHSKLYHAIRAAKPEVPILLVSMVPHWQPEFVAQIPERKEIIRATYEEALAAGDRRVAFIDGETLFDGDTDGVCTVDGCHPNDLGFTRMARHIGAAIENMLNNSVKE